MSAEYSIYEAKARLSALVREVREGHSIVITVHGKPVAELRPVSKSTPVTLAERIAELEATGEITAAKLKPDDPRAFRLGARKPGALKRFLQDRE